MRKTLNKRRNFIGLRLFIVFIAVIVAVYYIDAHIRPTIHTLADNQTRIRAVDAMNDAVTNELTEENIQYHNLIQINTNSQGEVTSLVSNIVNINNMKAKLAKRISQELNDKTSNAKLNIPVGTLFGWQITSGRGPRIKFDMTTKSYVKTQIKNEFQQAGINQTLHRIMLDVDVKITSVFAGYNVYSEINTNFCIAETVIVGVVPEAFTDVMDSESSLAGKIFDYGSGVGN
ncbi:MAG: sporulation protein YunB [Oscillospiraceae bacterium]